MELHGVGRDREFVGSLTRRVGPGAGSRAPRAFLGQISRTRPTLSRRPPWRCIGATMVTSAFAEFEAAAYGEWMIPPPLLPLVSRALVRMHGQLTSGFAFGPRRFPQVYRGDFSGPYHLCVRTHCAGWRVACGPTSSGFASGLRRRSRQHQPRMACPMHMHYSSSGPSASNSLEGGWPPSTSSSTSLAVGFAAISAAIRLAPSTYEPAPRTVAMA